MMAQKGFDHSIAIPGPTMFVQAAIPNWGNEGGALLPTTNAAKNWRGSSQILSKRPSKIARKNH